MQIATQQKQPSAKIIAATASATENKNSAVTLPMSGIAQLISNWEESLSALAKPQAKTPSLKESPAIEKLIEIAEEVEKKHKELQKLKK